MSQIHILDGQSNQGEILDYITSKNIISDNHKKSLEDTLETFDFITFADKRFSEFLEKRNRIIIPDEDGTLREFVIFEAARYKDSEGYKAQVFTHASYLELKKATVLYPESYKGTASQHGGRALKDTGWQIGIVEVKGNKKLSRDKHTNPYEFLKKIAKEYGAELRFRIEHNGNKVTGRYVDLLEQVGEWRGREVEFGRDLEGIRRVEKQDIVTALLGLGPEDEDGKRLEVLVEDEDALKRWGRIDEYGNLHHLIEPYEIQSDRQEMTEEEARQYTRTALNKRINTQVEYETTIIDLENVPGMESKKIRFGDTIRIKDTKFNPPLYLEARIYEQTRSIKSQAKKDIKLGDYIEYTEEEVNDIWNQLRKDIQKRVTAAEMAEYTYDKLTIDDKDEQTYEDGKTFAEATGIEAKEFAESKASDAEKEAKEYAKKQDEIVRTDLEKHAEKEADSALSQAKQYAVAKEVYENEMEKIADDLEKRAPIEYVDGEFKTIKDDLDKIDTEIEKKADGSKVYTIEDVDNMINNTVSKTDYEEDMDGVVSDIESQGTRIGQNEEAIGLKADSSELDDVEKSLNKKVGEVEVTAEGAKMTANEVRANMDDFDGKVEKLDASVETLADEVKLKASQSSVDSIEGRVENAESELKVLPGKIELKADSSKVDGIDDRLGNAEISIDGLENEIELKVDDEETRSIFKQEADSFTFDADQINFEGHVFGKDASFEGELKGASGTFGDVTVTDGDFNLKDENTGNKYSATPRRNMIKDHSFELIPQDPESMDGDSAIHNWLDIRPYSLYEDSAWRRKGNPKVSVALAPDEVDALPIFGEQAIVVKDANYVRQYVSEGVGAGSVYTVSGHFKRHWKKAPGKPRIEIWHVMANGDRDSKILNSVFERSKEDYSVSLHSTTFTVPNSFGFGDSLEVIISGGDDNWVQCDGVQMVEGTRPAVYQPEDSIWEVTKGNYRPITQPKSLWSGALFLQENQKIKPDRFLQDCMTGWILQWQRYDDDNKVKADNNFQYTFIPKISVEYNGEGRGHRATLTRGSTDIYKYFYVYNEYVEGKKANGEGKSRQLVLTGIYEF